MVSFVKIVDKAISLVDGCTCKSTSKFNFRKLYKIVGD